MMLVIKLLIIKTADVLASLCFCYSHVTKSGFRHVPLLGHHGVALFE